MLFRFLSLQNIGAWGSYLVSGVLTTLAISVTTALHTRSATLSLHME